MSFKDSQKLSEYIHTPSLSPSTPLHKILNNIYSYVQLGIATVQFINRHVGTNPPPHWRPYTSV